MDWGCRLCSSQPRPKVMGQTWKYEGGNDLDFNKTNHEVIVHIKNWSEDEIILKLSKHISQVSQHFIKTQSNYI